MERMTLYGEELEFDSESLISILNEVKNVKNSQVKNMIYFAKKPEVVEHLIAFASEREIELSNVVLCNVYNKYDTNADVVIALADYMLMKETLTQKEMDLAKKIFSDEGKKKICRRADSEFEYIEGQFKMKHFNV